MIIGLCDRFHCLPSQLYDEDPELFRMLEILKLGQREEEPVHDDQ